MLLENIVGAFVTIILALIDLLPEITVTEGTLGFIGDLYAKVVDISLIFPLEAFFIFTGTVFLFYTIKFVMKLISWILRKIPVASVS